MRLLTQKFCYIGLLIGLCNLSAPASASGSPAEKAALGTLDQFMVAFNARDMQAWADTIHFPHIRIASGQVSIFESAEAFQARKVFDSLKKIGWSRSQWIDRTITLSSPDKVHIETIFERLDADGASIGRYQSLYIVTQQNGRWGIQARSSLAP